MLPFSFRPSLLFPPEVSFPGIPPYTLSSPERARDGADLSSVLRLT